MHCGRTCVFFPIAAETHELPSRRLAWQAARLCARRRTGPLGPKMRIRPGSVVACCALCASGSKMGSPVFAAVWVAGHHGRGGHQWWRKQPGLREQSSRAAGLTPDDLEFLRLKMVEAEGGSTSSSLLAEIVQRCVSCFVHGRCSDSATPWRVVRYDASAMSHSTPCKCRVLA